MARLTTFSVVLLELSLTCFSFGQGRAASAAFGKDVRVNGSPPLLTEVIPGDAIRVPANSFLVLRDGQDRVLTAENTDIQYLDKSIDLAFGTARIETANGVGVRVHGNILKPTLRSTYQVSWVKHTGIVIVYEGQVEFTSCKKKITVPSDHVAEFKKTCDVTLYPWGHWTTTRGVIFGSSVVTAPAICTTVLFSCLDAIVAPRPAISSQ